MEMDLERLYFEYSDKVYHFIYILVRNKETAEDLTQETFYKAYKGLDHFNDQSSHSTWLLKIARNTTYDYFRRKRIIQFFTWGNEVDIDHQTLTPENSTLRNETHSEIHTALLRLKKDYRDVIILRKINECSIKETAAILGWTEAKVKSKMSRGIEALKVEIDEKAGAINE